MTARRQSPRLPDSAAPTYAPFQVEGEGDWLILSDLHVPYHEPKVVEAAIAYGRRLGVTGVFLNGDVLDYHELSTFDRDPSKTRYREERKIGLALLEYLRYKFPAARMLYKDGNHEERLARYVMRRAEAIWDEKLFSTETVLKLKDYDVEHVGDKRVVRLGKLNVLHGHEYRPTIQAPVNPARGLFLRSKGLALCGHFHQTSEHHEPTITGKPQGCWSTGCLCHLYPTYMPLNKWNHGFAVVTLTKSGDFSVRNLRVIDGAVV